MRFPTSLRSLVASRTLRTIVLVGPVLMPILAMAQEEEGAPPTPGLKQTSPVWLGYLFMAVLLAVVIVVSLIPSKRGHQD